MKGSRGCCVRFQKGGFEGLELDDGFSNVRWSVFPVQVEADESLGELASDADDADDGEGISRDAVG